MELVLIPITLILFPLLLGFLRNWQVERSPKQALFLSGKIPDPLPNGFCKGSVDGIKTRWMGKKFNLQKSSGINIIDSKEVYPFKTYTDYGLKDKKIKVLKIDYNIPKNPLWLRLILDELVEIEKHKYLGRAYLKVIPHLPFCIGFFKLEKLS